MGGIGGMKIEVGNANVKVQGMRKVDSSGYIGKENSKL
jgi:hypothetical protein